MLLKAIPHWSDELYLRYSRDNQHALIVDPVGVMLRIFVNIILRFQSHSLITHNHSDHIGGVAELRKYYPFAPIMRRRKSAI